MALGIQTAASCHAEADPEVLGLGDPFSAEVRVRESWDVVLSFPVETFQEDPGTRTAVSCQAAEDRGARTGTS